MEGPLTKFHVFYTDFYNTYKSDKMIWAVFCGKGCLFVGLFLNASWKEPSNVVHHKQEPEGCQQVHLGAVPDLRSR